MYLLGILHFYTGPEFYRYHFRTRHILGLYSLHLFIQSYA